MRRRLWVVPAALAFALPLAAQEAAAPLPAGARYIEREFRLPAPESFPNGLDALEVYVDTPGKHPLALLTHGTSDKPQERMQLTPWSQLPQALWFARRGYVVLVIIRRGYGTSGGRQDGTYGGCRPGEAFRKQAKPQPMTFARPSAMPRSRCLKPTPPRLSAPVFQPADLRRSPSLRSLPRD